jgi:hypothetical protein
MIEFCYQVGLRNRLNHQISVFIYIMEGHKEFADADSINMENDYEVEY